MPELPDIVVYLQALAPRVKSVRLLDTRLASPFLLRSVDPPLGELDGRRVMELERLGKRIVFEFEDELFLILHLMIAGRLRWKVRPGVPVAIPARVGLAALDFQSGTLLITEAGSHRRASLHVVRGRAGLDAHDPGGLEVLESDAGAFFERLDRERHTLKRALTDPRLFSGIGNAYSDEILHAARLSPFKLTTKLDPDERQRLFVATRDTLEGWTRRLREETGDAFPEKVTAFRPGMAVHGRHGKPCPVCASPIQRIVYASNESNYCAKCQNAGRLLADRALSRLLKQDWPRTLDELEQRRASRTPR